MSDKKPSGIELLIAGKAAFDVHQAKLNSDELVRLAKERDKREAEVARKAEAVAKKEAEQRVIEARRAEELFKSEAKEKEAEAEVRSEVQAELDHHRQVMGIADVHGLTWVGALAADMVMARTRLGVQQAVEEVREVAKREDHLSSILLYRPGNALSFDLFAQNLGTTLPKSRMETLCAAAAASLILGTKGSFSSLLSDALAIVKSNENAAKKSHAASLATERKKRRKRPKVASESAEEKKEYLESIEQLGQELSEAKAVLAKKAYIYQLRYVSYLFSIFSVIMAFYAVGAIKTLLLGSSSVYFFFLAMLSGVKLVEANSVVEGLSKKLQDEVDTVKWLDEREAEAGREAEEEASAKTVPALLPERYLWVAFFGNSYHTNSLLVMRRSANESTLSTAEGVAVASARYWLYDEEFQSLARRYKVA